MYKDKKILAIVPARGGSKGLPHKNIKPLLGKPLIGWSLEQAKNCSYVDEIFVSTDSAEIAKVAEDFGVKVPALRPPELAADTSSSMDVILHAINSLEKEGKFFDCILLVEPTSPLRETQDLDKAVEMLINTKDAESIVGVCKAEGAHPDFLSAMDKGFLVPYNKSVFSAKRRQDLQDLYFFEGSLYLSYVDSLKKRRAFYHEKTLGYEVPKYKSFEVDDIVDFKIIEALMSAKQKGEI